MAVKGQGRAISCTSEPPVFRLTFTKEWNREKGGSKSPGMLVKKERLRQRTVWRFYYLARFWLMVVFVPGHHAMDRFVICQGVEREGGGKGQR